MSHVNYIYSISDPRTMKVYYVGRTNNYENRIKFHMRNPPNGDMWDFMQEMEKEKLRPLCKIEKIVRAGLGEYWEKWYMWNFKNNGHPITNRTSLKNFDENDIKYLQHITQ